MPLPEFLLDGYKDWKGNIYNENVKLYKELEYSGQKPKALVISLAVRCLLIGP